MRDRCERGFSICEALAALTLIGIGLLVSFGVVYRAKALDELVQEGQLRAWAAETVMEETLARPYGEIRSRKIVLSPGDVRGQQGWVADVRVSVKGSQQKEIIVTVLGNGRQMELRTVTTPWRNGP